MISEVDYLNVKDIGELRDSLLESQNSICPLCNSPIEDGEAVLDHDHNLGNVRQVLHRQCNSYEGLVLNKFKRMGVHKLSDIKSFLLNLIKYWEVDYSMNLIHPREKPKAKKLTKRSFNILLRELKKDKIYKRKLPEYPKSKKMNKDLEKLFNDYNITPQFYEGK